MKPTERYNIIKKICEQKNPTDQIGQLPTTEADLQDEFSRFNTTLENRTPEQDSHKWQNQFLQNLIFGTSWKVFARGKGFCPLALFLTDRNTTEKQNTKNH